MSIKTFIAKLNGGSASFPEGDLVFSIYGSADGYTTPIAITLSDDDSDDVTILGDSVTINNVEIGDETLFKITAKTATNESPVSVPYTYSEETEIPVVTVEDLISFDSSNISNLTLGTGNEVQGWVNNFDSDNPAVNLTGENEAIYDPAKKAVVFSGQYDRLVFPPTYIKRGSLTYFCVYETDNIGARLMHMWPDVASTVRTVGWRLKSGGSIDVQGYFPGGVTDKFSNAQWVDDVLIGKVIIAVTSDSLNGIDTLYILSDESYQLNDTYEYTPTDPSFSLIDRLTSLSVTAASPLKLYHDSFRNTVMSVAEVKAEMNALNTKHNLGLTPWS